MNRLIVVGLAICGLATGPSPWEQFRDAWTGQTVTLKRPLYELLYTNQNMMGTAIAKRDSLVVVDETLGIYYEGGPGKKRRPDLQRLCDEVSAITATGGPEAARPSPSGQARLLTFPVGVKVKIVAVKKVGRGELSIVLREPLAREWEVTTRLTIRRAQDFSKAFTEREAIEAVLLEFFEPG